VLAEANVLPETDIVLLLGLADFRSFGRDDERHRIHPEAGNAQLDPEGDRMHMMFNFQVNQNLFYALASADARPLIKAMKATRPRPATAQWGMFLRNHDELDLGRLSERQRQQVFAAFAPDPEMQLYERGIRRRLAPMFDGDRRRLELAYSLMFTLPGTPVLRYGDELGMGDDLKLPERNCARTPMQWSNEPHSGFTKSDKPHIPVISGGPYGFEHINAAIQRRHPDSLLNWTERIIRMRKEVPEVGWGDFTIIPSRDPGVLIMRYDWRNNWVLFVHNLDAKPREVTFSVGLEKENAEQAKVLVNLLGEEHSRADRNGKHRLVIEAYGYRWFRVGGLDYLLRRSDIDQPAS
jgi:maltose alpha-D-glucosyltransferase / alpha-amylase